MKLFRKTFSVFILTAAVLLASTAAFAETDNKVREMANETYLTEPEPEPERTKTSDKHQFAGETDPVWYKIILDLIGL